MTTRSAAALLVAAGCLLHAALSNAFRAIMNAEFDASTAGSSPPLHSNVYSPAYCATACARTLVAAISRVT